MPSPLEGVSRVVVHGAANSERNQGWIRIANKQQQQPQQRQQQQAAAAAQLQQQQQQQQQQRCSKNRYTKVSNGQMYQRLRDETNL